MIKQSNKMLNFEELEERLEMEGGSCERKCAGGDGGNGGDGGDGGDGGSAPKPIGPGDLIP